VRARICKEFVFEAAHQLHSHSGKCRNLHGHTYRVQVFLQGEVGVPGGMVRDFSEIQWAFDSAIKPYCDHQFLNSTLPVSCTTAELIAGWILKTLRSPLPQIVKVRVYETLTSYAEVSVDDLGRGEDTNE